MKKNILAKLSPFHFLMLLIAGIINAIGVTLFIAPVQLYGDKLGRIWVEGTNVDCALYWGDSEGQFGRGAGCRAESDCVLPGENGTVFIGGHTGTYFSDLGSTQLGAIIHLETDWGDFTYKVTDMQVIQETDVDKVRWGTEEPSCILYTCYPFGILTHTPQRYAVYADPVSADEYGVVPAETTEK